MHEADGIPVTLRKGLPMASRARDVKYAKAHSNEKPLMSIEQSGFGLSRLRRVSAK